jgi:hypothetical protein
MARIPASPKVAEPPSAGAAYGTPTADFRVPGQNGLVEFRAGRRIRVEASVRAMLPADAPIEWETK